MRWKSPAPNAVTLILYLEGVAADGGAVQAGGRERWKVRRYRRGMWARLREQMTLEQAAEFAGKE